MRTRVTLLPPAAKDLVRHLLHVDPMRRYTAAEVLAHRWVAGGTASQRPLSGTINNMTQYMARSRFRGAVASVIETMKRRVRTGEDGHGHGGAGAAPSEPAH